MKKTTTARIGSWAFLCAAVFFLTISISLMILVHQQREELASHQEAAQRFGAVRDVVRNWQLQELLAQRPDGADSAPDHRADLEVIVAALAADPRTPAVALKPLARLQEQSDRWQDRSPGAADQKAFLSFTRKVEEDCQNAVQALAEASRRIDQALDEKWDLSITMLLTSCLSTILLAALSLRYDKLVSSQRKAQAALQESQQHFRQIFEYSNDAIFLADPVNNVLLDVNPRACTLVRCTREELLARPLSQLFPDERQEYRRFARAILRHGESWSNELMIQCHDGTAVPCEISANLVDLSGRSCVLALARDITLRKRTEEQLLEARRFAEATSHAKTEFLANMSHEIRTPMTAILGYAEMLLDRNLGENERQDAVQTICRNGVHLLSLLNGILDLSKIEAGKLHVERIDLDPWELVSQVHEMMQARAQSKGLEFEFTRKGPLPTKVHSDPTRIQQILMNLIGNAIKFTASGSVGVELALVKPVSEEGAELSFTVADTGIGLTQNQVERLFEPFAQADTSTSRRFGGTGLGLAISNRLARALGGRIEVTSTPGEGSKFVLTVPTGPLAAGSVNEAPAADRAPRPLPTSIGDPQVRASGKVLVAEDGIDNQRLIAFLLRRSGCDVHSVCNGREAVDEAQRAMLDGAPYELVLMDMQMPVLDGYAATRELRQRGYSRPVVALTACALDADRDRCLAAGCDDYLSKPLDRASLAQIVGKYMAGIGNGAVSTAPAREADLG